MNVQKANYSRCMSELQIWTRTEKTIRSQPSWEHELLKCQIIYLLKKAKHKVVAEAEFKNHAGVADVLDACCLVCYEVLNTETIEDFEDKKSYYPKFLKLIPVKVGEFDMNGLIKFLGVD